MDGQAIKDHPLSPDSFIVGGEGDMSGYAMEKGCLLLRE
jgi:hypothetical protein